MRRVTVADLLTMPDGYIYEVVEGVLVRMADSGKKATRIGGLSSSRWARSSTRGAWAS